MQNRGEPGKRPSNLSGIHRKLAQVQDVDQPVERHGKIDIHVILDNTAETGAIGQQPGRMGLRDRPVDAETDPDFPRVVLCFQRSERAFHQWQRIRAIQRHHYGADWKTLPHVQRS